MGGAGWERSETLEEHMSGWGTWPNQPEGPSGHADDGGEPTEAKDKRAQIEGVPHHQGSSSLYQFGRNWVCGLLHD